MVGRSRSPNDVVAQLYQKSLFFCGGSLASRRHDDVGGLLFLLYELCEVKRGRAFSLVRSAWTSEMFPCAKLQYLTHEFSYFHNGSEDEEVRHIYRDTSCIDKSANKQLVKGNANILDPDPDPEPNAVDVGMIQGVCARRSPSSPATAARQRERE